MAEVDTSTYPRAENNLMQSLGAAAQFRNANEQNKLLKLQQQQGQVGLDQSKIDLAHKQFGFLSQTLGSLAQDPRIGTAEGPQMLHAATQQLVQQGIITPDIANVELQNMPKDPTQLPQYLRNLNVRVQDAANQFSQIYGTPSMVDNGTVMQPASVSPITGIHAIGAPIQKTLSPEQRSDLVTTTNPQGQTVVIPKSQVLQQSGVNPLTAMPDTSAQNPANNLVSPPQPVESRPLAPPSSMQPQQGGGVAITPPAGTVEGLTKAASVSSDKYAQDAAREANYQQDVLPLEKALPALEALGDTGTGPGTEQLQEIQSFLTSMGILKPTDGLKNFDEARKYLVQYARSAGDTGTNDKLAAAFAGNSSIGISNAAAKDVVKTNLALRRMQNAQIRAFTATGKNPAEYSKWATEFNANNDPVAFGFDLMSGAERKKYFAKMSQADKQKFLSSLATATKLGIVAPPSVNQGAQ